ncbi:hypothetical protein GLOIN_2v1538659, partial [Rhizophagus irregularis DAOM 181602=DAOM 197198]
ILYGRVFVLLKIHYTITSKNIFYITYTINLIFILKIVNFFLYKHVYNFVYIFY